MKMRVFGNSDNDKKEIFFRLEQTDLDDLNLYVCDEKGLRRWNGNILRITRDGYLLRNESINEDIGLKLNDAGQIKEE